MLRTLGRTSGNAVCMNGVWSTCETAIYWTIWPMMPRSIKGHLLNTSSSLLSSGAVCWEQCVTISKAHSVFEGSECVHCELFSMRMLRSCLSLLSGEKGQASAPRRSDPAAVNIKLSGRKKFGRKRCTTNRENHPFTNTFWSTSCFLLLTSFLKMLISFSSRIWHLSTLPKAPKVG